MLISKVLVFMTGGTISSRRVAGGASVATDMSDDLLAGLASVPGFINRADLVVEAHDIMLLGSYLLKPDDMLQIARRIRDGLLAEDVVGVVVTHGTDTMEETAFLVDLLHDDPRPVVFTGAQRPADAPDTDGPRNIADAVTVASQHNARGLGVLIAFDGQIFAAAGTRKTQTLAPAAFLSTASGPIGRVRMGSLVLMTAPCRHDLLDIDSLDLHGVRVDVVPFYPGADTTALRAVAAAGATGIVLEGTGSGNVNPEFCAEVARLTEAGVVIALSTRVANGPVVAIYGAGGGRDAVEAGAVPIGTLRSSQARMLLIALFASLRDPEQVRTELLRRMA